MAVTAAFIEALASAVVEGRTFPRFPDDLDLAGGEAMQADLARAVSGIAGLKAGVGDESVQRALGLDGPLLGYLYWGRDLNSGVEFAADPAARFECELGVRVSEAGEILSLCPVIELVRPGFADSAEMTGANLAACNVAADRFIVGEEQPWTAVRTGEVIASQDGQVILQADLTEAFGGPEVAVEWLIGETTRRGIDLWDRLLFITGACGQAIPVDPGSYEVDFGPLGKLAFTAR